MNYQPIGVYTIAAVSLIGIVCIVIDYTETWELVIAGLAAALVLGLVFRVDLARRINSALFFFNAVLTGLMLTLGVGYFVYYKSAWFVFTEMALSILINIILIAYSWWAAKYLNRPSIKRWFTTNR